MSMPWIDDVAGELFVCDNGSGYMLTNGLQACYKHGTSETKWATPSRTCYLAV